MHQSVAIREQFTAAQQAYLAASDANATRERELRDLTIRVKELQQALSASIVGDAVPCSRCMAIPHGLRHVRAAIQKGSNEAKFRHVFEIGCLACEDVPKDVYDGDGRPIKKADDRRGFGETPARPSGPELDQFAEAAIAEAREQWNQKNQGR